MRRMLGLLCLTLAVGLPSTASADYVVDEFDAPQGGGTSLAISDGEGNPVTRSLDFGNQVAAGNLTLLNNSNGVTYDYLLSSIDPNANLLVLRGASYSSLSSALLTMTVTSLGGTETSVSRSIADGFTGDLYLDITSLSEIQESQSIQLSLASANAGSLNALSFGLVSVPEPASLALMGLAVASAGGVGAVRRRRSKSDSADELVPAV